MIEARGYRNRPSRGFSRASSPPVPRKGAATTSGSASPSRDRSSRAMGGRSRRPTGTAAVRVSRFGCPPEVGGRRSEAGGRRSEVGSRKSEVGGRRADVGGRRSEVGGRRSAVAGQG